MKYLMPVKKKKYQWITLLLFYFFILSCSPDRDLVVMTVRGAINADSLGVCLTHEHVLVDFIGADSVTPDRYDLQEVIRMVLPFLMEAKELGCQTFFECTPAYLGRDPELLLKLSELSGLQIVTNTGYYGARNDQHLPKHVFSETAVHLADRWISEWESGIDGTEIKPGFIKIGVDPGSLSELHRKIVKAAALTHLKTGLAIAAHTGPATGAFEEIEILKEYGVDPSAFIWIHAQNEKSLDLHIKAARLGVFVSFDGLGWSSSEEYVKLISNMKSQNLLHQVLISHDAGWYHVGEPGGGQFKDFGKLFTELIPALKQAGFNQDEIDQLLIINPRNAFGVRVRKYH